MYRRGFTLIELLVVISIIALLSSVVLSAVNTARTKAQIAEAKQDMALFAKLVGIASGESYKTLMTMSSNGGAAISNCSSCQATCTGVDLRNTTNACYTEWAAVLSGVQSNANGAFGNLQAAIARDPWGSPYLVDQNHGEGGNCSATNVDSIFSVGPDGMRGTADDVSAPVPIPLPPRCP